jgi:hypothetical protein
MSLTTIKWSGLEMAISNYFMLTKKDCLLVLTSIGTLAIPIGLSIAINHMAFGTGNGDIGARNDNWIEVVVIGVAKGLHIKPLVYWFERNKRSA